MRYLFVLFFAIPIYNLSLSQSNVNLTINGWVKDFTTKENIFGSTVYLIQNGSVVGKSVTERNGYFSIIGLIDPKLNFEVLSSKPNYYSKKVLINLASYKRPSSRKPVDLILQYSDEKGNQSGELEFSLYKKIEHADLSFTKNEYAENFTWDATKALVVAEGLNPIMDERAQQVYDEAKTLNSDDLSNADSTQIANQQEAIKNQIENLLKKASEFSSDKNYNAALNEYQKALQLISNSPNNSMLISLKDQATLGLNDTKSKKETEDQVFTNQLTIQKNNIKTNREGIEKAQNFLTSPFMKGRANDPEVLKLQNQINQLVDFYDKLDQAMSVLSSDSTRGYSMLQKVYQLGLTNSSFTPPVEITSIKSKLDELNVLFANKTNNINSNVNTLEPPGELVNTSKKDVLNELKITKDDLEFSDQDAIEKKIREAEVNSAISNRLNEANLEDSQDKLNEWKLKKDQLELKIGELQESQRAQLTISLDSLNYYISKRDALNKKVLDEKSIEFQIIKLYIDSLNNSNKRYLENLSDETRASIEDFLTLKSQLNVQIDSLNALQQQTIEAKNFQVEKEIYNKNEANKVILTEQAELVQENKLLIDSLNYSDKLYLDSLSDNMREKIDRFKTNQSIENAKLDSSSIQRKIDMEYEIFNLESSIFRRDSTQTAIINTQNERTQQLLLSNEKNYKEQLEFIEQLQNEHRSNLEEFLTNKTKNKVYIDSLSEVRRSNTMELDLELYKFLTNNNLDKKEEDERRFKQLDVLANTKVENRHEPNNLANKQGKIYEKDSIHEELYEIKNEFGYVEVVITRRIVVDKYGYGTVYEHRIDAMGNFSFSRNGQPITEYQWNTESNNLSMFD